MPTKAQINQESTQIARLFQRTGFESGIPVIPKPSLLTHQTGLYAIKHENVVLYVGKANSYRTRFQSGHDGLLRILLNGIPPTEIYLVLYPLRGRWVEYILELEKLVIFSLNPEYNKRQPSVAEVTKMLSSAPRPITSGHLKEILRYLPENIQSALEEYADANQLSDLQVLEMAIAGFLDLESTEFRHVEGLSSIAQMRNQIELLQTQVDQMSQIMQRNGLTPPEGLNLN